MLNRHCPWCSEPLSGALYCRSCGRSTRLADEAGRGDHTADRQHADEAVRSSAIATALRHLTRR